MKLTQITVIEYDDYTNRGSEGKPAKKLSGTVEFQGQSGKMVFPLTEIDFTNIEQLLRVKCKVLGAEA